MMTKLSPSPSLSRLPTSCIIQKEMFCTLHYMNGMNGEIFSMFQVDFLLFTGTPKVPLCLLGWLVCLAFVMMLDFLYKVSNKSYHAFLSYPTYVYYFIAYMKEIMFVDDVCSLRTRFRTLNAELATCLANANRNVGKCDMRERQEKNVLPEGDTDEHPPYE